MPAILQYRPSDLYLTFRKETMAILQEGTHTPLHIWKYGLPSFILFSHKILMFHATHKHLASTPTIYYIIVKVHIHRPRLMQTQQIFITFRTFIGQKNKRNPTLNLFYGSDRRPPSAISMYGGDMSPSYLLFQTLLPLFWTLTCMI